MDEVQKPSISECYTLSLEPFGAKICKFNYSDVSRTLKRAMGMTVFSY
jgi:hypothetical protein